MKVTQVFKSGDNFLNIQVDTNKLELIEAALNKRYKTQVGILGDKNQRSLTERAKTGKARPVKGTSAPETNAEIGALHEFGRYGSKPVIPARSFLRMPLTFYLKDEVNSGAKKINDAISNADLKKAYALLGIAAEAVVQKAFASGGFGNWPKLSPVTIARKGSSAILIDSGQLRKAVTSRVV